MITNILKLVLLLQRYSWFQFQSTTFSFRIACTGLSFSRQIQGWCHNSRLQFSKMFYALSLPPSHPCSYKTGLMSCFIMHDVSYGSIVAGRKKNGTKRRKVVQSIMQVKYWYADEMWQQQRTAWGFFSSLTPPFLSLVCIFIIVISCTNKFQADTQGSQFLTFPPYQLNVAKL